MKKMILLGFIVMFLSVNVYAQEKHSYKPKEGYVPNAETAIKIAEAVWLPIYGNKGSGLHS